MNKKESILVQVESYSYYSNYFDVLLLLVQRNLNCYVDELETRNPRELLNTNEIEHLFGYWVKNIGNSNRKTLNVTDAVIELEKLMNKFHEALFEEIPVINARSKNLSEELENRMISSAYLQETIFYSSGGVYDYQYAVFSVLKYAEDKEWLKKHYNFDLEIFLDLFVYIKSCLNFKFNKGCKGVEEPFVIHKRNYVFERFPQFKIVLDAFSWDMKSKENKEFKNIGDINFFKQKPIIDFGDRYVIPVPYLLAETIYESPFYWMKDDEQYDLRMASKNRGKAAENIVYNLLTKVFSDSNVFSNVLVKKNKTKTITDLDVCVVNDDTLIVFQIKSKKLTQLSKQGNVESVKADFQKSVSDAYQQSMKAYKPIIRNECILVNEMNQTILKPQSYNKILTVCVVLDDYASINIHSNIFYEKEKITPMAISIFQLDIITEYLRTPDVFCEYISSRTYNSKYFLADGELAYLSFFLRNGLNRLDGSDKVFISEEYAQFFDYDYYMSLVDYFEPKLANYIDGVGRNDFCFCGSGKKFDKCCIDILKS